MSRKDILAAGGHKATFAGGVGENDIFRNVAPEEENTPVVVPEVVKPVEPKKRFIPLENVLLVRRAESKLNSSIVITEGMEKEAPAEGTVIAAGLNKVGLSQGDYIVFGKYAGAEFRLNGETLLLMGVDEVKGTLIDAEPAQILPEETGGWEVSACSAIGKA